MSDQACISREHQIVDALFGDLDAAGHNDLQQHMETCAGCTASYRHMQQTLAITSQVPEPEMSDAYWDTYYERLEERMASAPNSSGLQNQWAHLVSWLENALIPRPAVLRPYLQPALRWSAALALVLVGVFIGRQFGGENAPVPAEGPLAVETDPMLTTVQLSEQTHQYLDRSKVLLLGLVNFEVGEDDPAFINLAQQQEVAGELIQQAAFLKEELTENREQQLSALVEDLEMILLQIANLEIQQDVPSIELIQRGVDRGSLLLKINLEKMKLSEQEMAAPQRGESSKKDKAEDVRFF
ncbi:MAG: hypothetical protein AB8G77_05130 [Rhodothermales bacterium]